MLKLNINVLSNLKVLKFKKKKWKSFLYFFKNELNSSKFKKYKIVDQIKFLISKKSIFELNFKNQHFKKLFIFSKIFTLFFGNFSRNYYDNLKKKIKKSCKIVKKFVFEFLESRLDLVLHRSKWFSTIKSAKQCIAHGHVAINKKVIKNNSFVLKSGDLISINLFILNNCKIHLVCSTIWPVTPSFLVLNYKTMEIIFLGNFIKETNFIFYSFFYLKLHKFLINL
jgi:ribosomal protein S4